MNQLDYTAFDQEISFRERMHGVEGWLIGMGIVSSVLLLLFAIGSLFMSDGVAAFFTFGVFAAIFTLLTVLGYANAGTRMRLKNFAIQNGMAYTSNASYDGRAGMIFGKGDAKIFSDLLVASGYEFAEIGNYQYTIGSGKNRTTYDYGFVRIKLPRRLPNMILDSKKNNFFGGRLSNLQTSFTGDQRLSLEGDFDKYFTLYAPEEYKTDALYVFTPDVMQALVDAVHSYDCEVIDDDFYIYSDTKFKFTNKDQYEEILAITRALKPELVQQTDYYADARVGDRSLNIIGEGGKRLKTGIPLWTVITLIIVVGYYILSILFGFRN